MSPHARRLANRLNRPTRRITVGACRAIGELRLVPSSTLAAIQSAEQATRAYDAMELQIAVAYGGRQEIVDAVRGSLRNMASKGATFSEAIERLTPEFDCKTPLHGRFARSGHGCGSP